MTAVSSITSEPDLIECLTRYPHEMTFGEDPPETVMGRYFTRDVEYVNDGVLLDWDRLIAHARPARKNAAEVHVEVHEALVSGDRVAARYTLTAAMRKGAVLSNEIYMFGRLSPDGRLRRVDQITRTVPDGRGA